MAAATTATDIDYDLLTDLIEALCCAEETQINHAIQALAEAESLAWHQDNLLTRHSEPSQCPECGYSRYIARGRDVCTSCEPESDVS